jgi:hypothetical protein
VLMRSEAAATMTLFPQDGSVVVVVVIGEQQMLREVVEVVVQT